ncbi:MAG: putative Zn-dependent protease [Pseudohongiellaceae bacterium]|jgi:predicted Zn-dependent protease
MKYHNPEIPEGINLTNEHPLKDFFIMLAGISGAIIAAIFMLSLLADYFVGYIPFSVEQQLAQRFNQQISSAPNQQDTKVESYLQNLADQLAQAQQLPNDMSITVHYVDDDTINALATLGGNIIVFRGLLEKMPNENTLAMVVGHEIAHIKHRDPIISMGRGITVGIALMSIAGFGDSAVSQQLIAQIGQLTALNFSRQQEQDADAESLQALLNHYGHTLEAERLFEVFIAQEDELELPAFLSTHPQNEDRINAIKKQQRNQSSNVQVTALPTWLKDLLSKQRVKQEQK